MVKTGAKENDGGKKLQKRIIKVQKRHVKEVGTLQKWLEKLNAIERKGKG